MKQDSERRCLVSEVHSIWEIQGVRWVMGLGISLLLILVGGVGWLVHSERVDYEQALLIYQNRDEIEATAIRKELSWFNERKLDGYLEKEAKEVFLHYQQGKINYGEASDRLKWIRSLSHHPERIGPFQNQVFQLKESKQAFLQATNYAKEKKWGQAKACYQQVIPLDNRYEEAQHWVEEISRWELDDQMEQVLSAYEVGDYEVALVKVEKGLQLAPQHPRFLELKSEIQHQIQLEAQRANEKKQEQSSKDERESGRWVNWLKQWWF